MLENVHPSVLSSARGAAQWQVAALNFTSSPKQLQEGLQRSGLPMSGRVLVVIGYQGCITHDFAKLEQLAMQNNARLYVINGNTLEAGAEKPNYTPSIVIGQGSSRRPLQGEIITPRDASGKPLTPAEIVKVAGLLGLAATVEGQGTPVVSSTGVKLFVDGKSVEPMRKAEAATYFRG